MYLQGNNPSVGIIACEIAGVSQAFYSSPIILIIVASDV